MQVGEESTKVPSNKKKTWIRCQLPNEVRRSCCVVTTVEIIKRWHIKETERNYRINQQ